MTPLSKQIFILFIIILILFLATLGVLIYHRMFKKIVIKESSFRPLKFAYTFHKGDYQKNMQVMEKTLQKLQKEDIPVVSAATIYYDNPRKTKRSELRSEVGFIVADSIKQSQIDKVALKTIRHNNYIYTAFPYVSRFSIMIGAMRVYPAFKKYLKKKGAAEREIIEIYEMQNKTIIYLMPFE